MLERISSGNYAGSECPIAASAPSASVAPLQGAGLGSTDGGADIDALSAAWDAL